MVFSLFKKIIFILQNTIDIGLFLCDNVYNILYIKPYVFSKRTIHQINTVLKSNDWDTNIHEAVAESWCMVRTGAARIFLLTHEPFA